MLEHACTQLDTFTDVVKILFLSCIILLLQKSAVLSSITLLKCYIPGPNCTHFTATVNTLFSAIYTY